MTMFTVNKLCEHCLIRENLRGKTIFRYVDFCPYFDNAWDTIREIWQKDGSDGYASVCEGSSIFCNVVLIYLSIYEN